MCEPFWYFFLSDVAVRLRAHRHHHRPVRGPDLLPGQQEEGSVPAADCQGGEGEPEEQWRAGHHAAHQGQERRQRGQLPEAAQGHQG